MTDPEDMGEDELYKAIMDLAPPLRPYGVHHPGDIAYMSDRVREVFEGCNLPCPEDLHLRLVEMFLSEVEAIET